MDWQVALVAVIVAAAVWYLSRQIVGKWAGKKGGCGGCACAAKESTADPGNDLVPADQLTLRRPEP
jgi:hypothetical protein